MTSEQFCLKWNNYQSNIVSALGNLKLDEDFVDVTLSCEGRTIKAHKVILSACSHYFRDVFRETPCNHPIIILKDTQYADLESLVKYVYQGQVYISQENLSSFLKTADALQIKGLAEQSTPPPPPPPPQAGGGASESSSPHSSPDHHHHVNETCPIIPEAKQQSSSTFPAPSMSPVMSSSSPPGATTGSYPSQTPGAPSLIPRTSPIKIPTISHLKRNTFSNLAQYLSGSQDMSSPPLNDEPGGQPKKRKLTPPTKRYELPNYSGSTSTASPGSPPHSHSTEGGEQSLEIGEESDRDSSRSIESNDLAKAPLLSDYEAPTTKDPSHPHHHLPHLAPYHHHIHHSRCSAAPLLPHGGEKKDPEEHFGETLDLSKNSSRHIHQSANTTTTTYPNSSSISSMPSATHISGGVLEAALTASDPMSSTRSLGSISPAKRLGLLSGSSTPTSSSSLTTLSPSVIPNPSSGSSNKEKDGQGTSPAHEGSAITNREPSPTPSTPTNKNSCSSSSSSTNINISNNNNNNGGNNSNHPRNRWRCMQPRICNYCWKTFSNSFNLKQHIVNVHVQSQGVSCSLCEKVVKNKWYLRKHLVTAHGAPLKRVKGSEKAVTPPGSGGGCDSLNNNNNNNNSKTGKSASSKQDAANIIKQDPGSPPITPVVEASIKIEDATENSDSNKSLEVN